MTDEEIAKINVENYGIDLCCYCRECDKGISNPCEHKKDALHGYKDGFLAGLKLGRPKWHKVADGDLPNCEHGHTVFNQDLDRVIMRNGRFEHLDGYPAKVIAWCDEIPTYKDKE